MLKRFSGWLRGDESESFVRLKWSFLLMVALVWYTVTGAGFTSTEIAVFSSTTWFIGIAVFGFFLVAASRREGVRSTLKYMAATGSVRRPLLFFVLCWLAFNLANWAGFAMAGLAIGDLYDSAYKRDAFLWGSIFFLASTALLGFSFLMLMPTLFSRPTGINRDFMRGADFITKEDYLAELEQRFPERPQAAEIAGVPFPPGHERMHTAIAASTGAGKTTALRGLLETIRARGDRAIVLDNNSEFMRAFRQSGDVILSPFHEESMGWRLSNEARDLHDWDRLASGFVPEGSGNSAEWHDMAKSLFGAVGAGLFEVYDGTFTNAELQRVLIAAEASELAPLVAGTTAEVLAASDDFNARRLQSVRMSFIANLKEWRYVKDGDLSLRDWIAANSSQWMFMPYSDYEMTLARDLLAAWVDIMVTSALDRREGQAPARTTWIIIDELNSLGEIPALLVGATRLRKAGVAIVVAVQDFAQLRETYSENRAETLMNNFSNKLVLRTTEGNAAEYLSKQLGDREMMEDNTSYSTGNSSSYSYSQSIVMERLVLPSEIQKLPDLEGYLNFAGDWPVMRVTIPLPPPSS